MSIRRNSATWCLAACAAGALASCDNTDHGRPRPATRDAGDERETDAAAEIDAATPEVQRWVGLIEQSDIRLGAVVERGTRARIFFCGGPSSYETATRWVVVDIGDDGLYAYTEDGWRVTGAIDASRITGKLELSETESYTFRAEPVAAGTLAGLYEGQADCGRLGLIVTHSSATDEPSGQGACVGAGRLPEQVNPILPITLEGDEIRVQVDGVESRVKEATPPAR